MAATKRQPPEAETLESLSTLGGVRRAMARTYHRLRRPGKVDVARARVELVALQQIAELLMDRRDHRYQERLETLWRAHQEARGALALPASTSIDGDVVDAVPSNAVQSPTATTTDDSGATDAPRTSSHRPSS